MFRNVVFKWVTRLFLPDLARSMAQERALRLNEPEGAGGSFPEYVQVEDRGADVTLFCFSGMAVLFAGLPAFEFRKVLAQQPLDCNLVFFRDVRRRAYMVAPDGTADEGDFYEAKVREVMSRLGTRYNVALGASGGGAAAFWFATRCGMNQIIAFSPAFPANVWTSWRAQLRAYFDLKKLVMHPTDYAEVALIAVSSRWLIRQIRKDTGGKGWDVMATYRNCPSPRPRATVFFGEHCYSDAWQARLLSDLPEVKLAPVPTGRHNCPAHLKMQGRLGEVILNEVLEGMAEWKAGQNPRTARGCNPLSLADTGPCVC